MNKRFLSKCIISIIVITIIMLEYLVNISYSVKADKIQVYNSIITTHRGNQTDSQLKSLIDTVKKLNSNHYEEGIYCYIIYNNEIIVGPNIYIDASFNDRKIYQVDFRSGENGYIYEVFITPLDNDNNPESNYLENIDSINDMVQEQLDFDLYKLEKNKSEKNKSEKEKSKKNLILVIILLTLIFLVGVIILLIFKNIKKGKATSEKQKKE